MGDWIIVIEGTGPHHNKNNPGDADKMLERFLVMLKMKDQKLSHASITTGAIEECKNLKDMPTLDATKLAANPA